MTQPSEQQRLFICAHLVDRGLVHDLDPSASFLATEQAADLYETRQEEAHLIGLFQARSRQAIRLLDRYLFLMPTNPEEENALFSGFFEHIASDYERLIDPACNLHNINILISMLTKQIGNLNGINILDFGCGTGLSFGPLIATGASVIGMDKSVRMRTIAQARGERVLTLNELMEWPESFNGVIASYVFHLFPDVESIGAICKKLELGGAVIGNFHKGIGIDFAVELFRKFQCDAFAAEDTAETERHGKYLIFIKG